MQLDIIVVYWFSVKGSVGASLVSLRNRRAGAVCHAQRSGGGCEKDRDPKLQLVHRRLNTSSDVQPAEASVDLYGNQRNSDSTLCTTSGKMSGGISFTKL
jgi:hypothetical protein